MTDKKTDPHSGPQSMGHEWDGIEELNNPLPRWWLWTFYATIVFAVAYSVVYPAIPLLNSATQGTFGWSSRGQLAVETAQAEAARAEMREQLAQVDISTLDPKSPLMRAAVEGGRAAFRINCVQCHGSGAAGSAGYPNLNDDDWLWGGSMAEIHQTIAHGIREPGDKATRMSQMPAFGREGILQPAQIADTVSFIRHAARLEGNSASAQRGGALYQANCAVCHGADAKGGRQFGAPDLTDAIWLYGGDRDSLTHTIANARYGVMPAWAHRLDPATINMLTAYVHQLGGGE